MDDNQELICRDSNKATFAENNQAEYLILEAIPNATGAALQESFRQDRASG